MLLKDPQISVTCHRLGWELLIVVVPYSVLETRANHEFQRAKKRKSYYPNCSESCPKDYNETLETIPLLGWWWGFMCGLLEVKKKSCLAWLAISYGERPRLS
jgi:hypothetical protein